MVKVGPVFLEHSVIQVLYKAHGIVNQNCISDTGSADMTNIDIMCYAT